MSHKKIVLIFIILITGILLLLYKNSTTLKYQKTIYDKNASKMNLYKKLLSKNDEDYIRGILTNDDSLISMIVQTKDNSFYMNHNYKKEPSVDGATFLDYRDTLDSKKLIIYGHNSEKSDFKELIKYMDYYYTKKHQHIKLIIGDQIYLFSVFSVMLVPSNYSMHTKIEFDTAEDLKNHLNWMKNNSLFDLGVDVNINNQLLTLQTCYENSLLLVNLKRVGVESV